MGRRCGVRVSERDGSARFSAGCNRKCKLQVRAASPGFVSYLLTGGSLRSACFFEGVYGVLWSRGVCRTACLSRRMCACVAQVFRINESVCCSGRVSVHGISPLYNAFNALLNFFAGVNFSERLIKMQRVFLAD
jgi:hypothetical protein